MDRRLTKILSQKLTFQELLLFINDHLIPVITRNHSKYKCLRELFSVDTLVNFLTTIKSNQGVLVKKYKQIKVISSDNIFTGYDYYINERKVLSHRLNRGILMYSDENNERLPSPFNVIYNNIKEDFIGYEIISNTAEYQNTTELVVTQYSGNIANGLSLVISNINHITDIKLIGYSQGCKSFNIGVSSVNERYNTFGISGISLFNNCEFPYISAECISPGNSEDIADDTFSYIFKRKKYRGLYKNGRVYNFWNVKLNNINWDDIIYSEAIPVIKDAFLGWSKSMTDGILYEIFTFLMFDEFSGYDNINVLLSYLKINYQNSYLEVKAQTYVRNLKGITYKASDAFGLVTTYFKIEANQVLPSLLHSVIIINEHRFGVEHIVIDKELGLYIEDLSDRFPKHKIIQETNDIKLIGYYFNNQNYTLDEYLMVISKINSYITIYVLNNTQQNIVTMAIHEYLGY